MQFVLQEGDDVVVGERVAGALGREHVGRRRTPSHAQHLLQVLDLTRTDAPQKSDGRLAHHPDVDEREEDDTREEDGQRHGRHAQRAVDGRRRAEQRDRKQRASDCACAKPDRGDDEVAAMVRRHVDLAHDVGDVIEDGVRLHEHARQAEHGVLATHRHHAERQQRHHVVDHVDIPRGRAVGRQDLARRLVRVAAGVDGEKHVQCEAELVEEERLPKDGRRTGESSQNEDPRQQLVDDTGSEQTQHVNIRLKAYYRCTEC